MLDVGFVQRYGSNERISKVASTPFFNKMTPEDCEKELKRFYEKFNVAGTVSGRWPCGPEEK